MKKSNMLMSMLLVGVLSSSMAFGVDEDPCEGCIRDGDSPSFGRVDANNIFTPFVSASWLQATDLVETHDLKVWGNVEIQGSITMDDEINTSGIIYTPSATEATTEADTNISMFTGWYDADTFIFGYPDPDGVVDIGDGERANFPLIIDHTASHDILHLQNGSVAINGTFDDTANNHNALTINSNNVGSGGSDVGFSMGNVESDFKWTFRTFNPSKGFAASKVGTGGTEFEVGNTGTSLATTVVKMGGVVVFKNGHLVNKSGNELTSLVTEQSKMLAETITELRKAQEKIARLEVMQNRLAKVESLLTNLTLVTSNEKQEKLSLNAK